MKLQNALILLVAVGFFGFLAAGNSCSLSSSSSSNNSSSSVYSGISSIDSSIEESTSIESSISSNSASYIESVSSIEESSSVESVISYEIVTDQESLQVGDELIIASFSKGVTAGAISNQVLTSITTSFDADYKSIVDLTEETLIFTLGESDGYWTLANADGDLLGCTSAKKLSFSSGFNQWSITIDAVNNATIQVINESEDLGRILYNSTTPRFTTYTSDLTTAMSIPQLYRKTVR